MGIAEQKHCSLRLRAGMFIQDPMMLAGFRYSERTKGLTLLKIHLQETGFDDG
jgi:hypothetical protein